MAPPAQTPREECTLGQPVVRRRNTSAVTDGPLWLTLEDELSEAIPKICHLQDNPEHYSQHDMFLTCKD